MRRGIFRYAHTSLPWDFIVYQQSPRDLRNLRHWRPHAVIGDFGRVDLAAGALRLGVPVINLHGGRAHVGLPQVGVDDEAIGRMAAQHLVERGCERFRYVGFSSSGMPVSRWRGFASALASRGLEAESLFPYAEDETSIPSRPWEDPVRHVERWLARQELPVGIFACSDLVATFVSEACRHLGLRVPEDVAILGVDDDEDLCEGCHPPLTSIRLPYEAIGRRAAQLLDDLFHGAAKPAAPILLPPLQVVARQSTDLAAVDHAALAKALAFIQSAAARGVHVNEVARHAGMSRRSLERRFQERFNRSPHQEIRRVQLEIAKRLLRETDAKLDAVAAGCGLSSAIRLGLEFRQKLGFTPGEYRRQFRGRQGRPAERG